jgi:hypothetical protein
MNIRRLWNGGSNCAPKFRCGGVPSRPHLQRSDLHYSVCLMIGTAARAHDLPPEFLARVIWQESRFRPDTVGPRRRHGQSAQWIAQFMPGTAVEKGLLDPFGRAACLTGGSAARPERRGVTGAGAVTRTSGKTSGSGPWASGRRPCGHDGAGRQQRRSAVILVWRLDWKEIRAWVRPQRGVGLGLARSSLR